MNDTGLTLETLNHETLHHTTLKEATPTLVEMDLNFRRVPGLIIRDLEQYMLHILQRIPDPNFVYGYYREYKRGIVRTYYMVTNGIFALKFRHNVVLPKCPLCGEPKLFMDAKDNIYCEHYIDDPETLTEKPCKFHQPHDWKAAMEEIERMKEDY